MEQMHTEKGNTVFIGDQMFTDVFGANRTGIPSIMVKKIHWKEENSDCFKTAVGSHCADWLPQIQKDT